MFLDEIYLYVRIFLVSLERLRIGMEERRRERCPQILPIPPCLLPWKYKRKFHVSTIHVYLSIPPSMKHPLASFQLLLFCIKQLKKCSLRILGSIAVHSWCSFFFFFFHFSALKIEKEHLTAYSHTQALTRRVLAGMGASMGHSGGLLSWKDVLMIHVSTANDKRKNRACHLLASVPALSLSSHAVFPPFRIVLQPQDHFSCI